VKNVEDIFYPMLRGFQDVASPVCLSGKSNVLIKMSVERWWDDTDMGKPTALGEMSVSMTIGSPQT
jgi:hypothetical protein